MELFGQNEEGELFEDVEVGNANVFAGDYMNLIVETDIGYCLVCNLCDDLVHTSFSGYGPAFASLLMSSHYSQDCSLIRRIIQRLKEPDWSDLRNDATRFESPVLYSEYDAVGSNSWRRMPSFYIHFQLNGFGIFDEKSVLNRFGYLGSAVGNQNLMVPPLRQKLAANVKSLRYRPDRETGIQILFGLLSANYLTNVKNVRRAEAVALQLKELFPSIRNALYELMPLYGLDGSQFEAIANSVFFSFNRCAGYYLRRLSNASLRANILLAKQRKMEEYARDMERFERMEEDLTNRPEPQIHLQQQ